MDVTLAERIIKYIENHNPIPYSKIVQVASAKGFTELQVLEALEKVHKEKTISTRNRKNEIWYYLTPPPPAPKPAPKLPPYPYPTPCTHCHGTLCAECFPFYDPETDTIEKIKERNLELKRTYDQEKAKRGRNTARYTKTSPR